MRIPPSSPRSPRFGRTSLSPQISAAASGQSGGCIIVDSTRKGKRFPDSMSKTIPIWACVLNRAIKKHLQMMAGYVESGDGLSSTSSNEPVEMNPIPVYWDSSLHLPLWVLDTEKAAIERHLDEWTEQFEMCGADIASLALNLRNPLLHCGFIRSTLSG